MAANTQAGYWVDLSSFQPGRTYIDLQFTAGASGAVPTTFIKDAGITSVTKTGATTGIYVVTLSQVYLAGLLSFPVIGIKQATYSATTGACFALLTTNAVATTGAITVTFVNAAGAAVDLAEGDIVYFSVCVGAYVQR